MKSQNLKTNLWISLSHLLLVLVILAACSTPTGLPTQVVFPTDTPNAAPATAAPTIRPVQGQTGVPESQAPTAAPKAGQPLSLDAINPDQYTWKEIANGLTRPVDMADTGGGKILVLEQRGVILLMENGNLLPDPVLDIQDRVGSAGNEQGLLGIALHPKFDQNGYFYVNYTDVHGNTVIARFSLAPGSNQVDVGSEKVLLQIDQPFPNHNGGSMVFGPDGMLYMGLGDGGDQGDPYGNGQNKDVLLGKILRIDVDSGDPYSIPVSNPFAKGGGRAEVWLYGLRNPWRFSFDRQTGDLYIADVGQNNYEEIDFLPAKSPGGENFGWNYREGFHAYKGNPPAGLTLTDPILEYDHSQGCSVTGGFVYRGMALPELEGIYFYGDFCSGRVWGAQRQADGSWKQRQLFGLTSNISSFGQDQQGEIYLLDLKGKVFKLERQ